MSIPEVSLSSILLENILSIRVQEWSLILVGNVIFGKKSIRNYIVKIVIVVFLFLNF